MIDDPSRLIHGHARRGKISTEYHIWYNMKRRCFDPAVPAFRNYGGRGITVCDRWLDFKKFIADMGSRPKGKTIHRKNNNGNYEPSNCVWATTGEQANCTQRSRFVTMSGRTQTFTQWCDELRLNRGSAYDRLVRGWPPVKALTTPFKKGNYARGKRPR